MRNKFLLLVFLFSFSYAFTSNVNAQEERPTKKSALARLNKCAAERTEYNCNEDNAQYLVNLYFKGDKDLLEPLLNAGLNSDAALAEVLGDFYSYVVQTETENFLNAIAKKSETDQAELSKMAIWADGSGNTEDWEKSVRAKVEKIINLNNKLSNPAKIFIKQLNEFAANKEN